MMTSACLAALTIVLRSLVTLELCRGLLLVLLRQGARWSWHPLSHGVRCEVEYLTVVTSAK